MLPILQYIKNPTILYPVLFIRFFRWLPDRVYIRVLYRIMMGRPLNLDKPVTYNEKLQWLKLYNRRPEYTTMVDKLAVKEYVARIIGKDFIIPTIAVWENVDDIDWELLPEKFVLKTTHGGGSSGIVICKDKGTLNKRFAIESLRKSMKKDIYRNLKEWPYKGVPKRILAEPYFEDSVLGELPDYKFFCFNGEVKALFIATDRGSGNVKFDFFDSLFHHLDLVQQHPMSGKELVKPKCFDLMKDIASKLSKDIPHVRVDLYECNGKVYFGEMTFFHHGGLVPFHPDSWDRVFGEWITLPENSE